MSFLCNDDCVTPVKQMPGAGCKIVTRPSGIKRVIYAQCNVVFTSIIDLAEWQTYIDADRIHATGDIKGAKPKGSFTKQKVASCLPERIVAGEKTVNFTDANSDNTNFADYDFYNHIQDEQDSLKFGYLTCDDLFYGWFSNFSAEIDDVRTDDNNDVTTFDVTCTWSQRLMQKPVSLPGLNAILT